MNINANKRKKQVKAMERQLNHLYDWNDAYDLNREHRNELLRQAEHERLLRLVRTGERRSGLHRAVMAWTGHRLVASGRFLLNLADTSSEPVSANRLYVR